MTAWLWLGIASVLAAAANLLLRRGMRTMKHESSALDLLQHVLFSFSALSGGFCYVLAMIAWLLVLRDTLLTVAYPVFVSLTFTIILGAPSFVLNEKVTLRHAGGALLIAVGIALAV